MTSSPQRFDCETGFTDGLDAAVNAIGAGELVVVPTDTVYGVAADAFSPTAVRRLLEAKGRDRSMPPPVLIARPDGLDALAEDVPKWLRTMLDALWPGALTVVLKAQSSLAWDLGETHGTVALRLPDEQNLRALLHRTGPLAVSSANSTGEPAATTVDEAESMLGDRVAVYLDAGPSSQVASTILDVTSSTPRVLRLGAIGLDTLREYNNTIEPPEDVV